jgi:Coenzyme A transferase
MNDPSASALLECKSEIPELKTGMLVNLGIGIPTKVANFIPQDVKVFFQSENGLIGTGPIPEEGMAHPLLTDAGGNPVTTLPGACTFDSAMSFGLIRGGHVDVTVLGAPHRHAGHRVGGHQKERPRLWKPVPALPLSKWLRRRRPNSCCPPRYRKCKCRVTTLQASGASKSLFFRLGSIY